MPLTRVAADAFGVVTIVLFALFAALGLFCIFQSVYFRFRIRREAFLPLGYFNGPWVTRIALILITIWWGVGEIVRLSFLKRKFSNTVWQRSVCDAYILSNLGFAEPSIFFAFAFLLHGSLQKRESGTLNQRWNWKTIGYMLVFCVPVFFMQALLVFVGPTFVKDENNTHGRRKIAKYFIRTSMPVGDTSICTYPLFGTIFLGLIDAILMSYVSYVGSRVLSLVIKIATHNMDLLLSLVSLLLVAGGGRYANFAGATAAAATPNSQTPAAYWQKVLPGTSMPPAISDLLAQPNDDTIAFYVENTHNAKIDSAQSSKEPMFINGPRKPGKGFDGERKQYGLHTNNEKSTFSYGPHDEEDQKKVSFSYKPQDEEDQKRTTFSLGSFSYGPHDEEDQKKVSFSYKPQDEEGQKRATFSLGSQVYKDQREIALMYKTDEEANQKRSIIIKDDTIALYAENTHNAKIDSAQSSKEPRFINGPRKPGKRFDGGRKQYGLHTNNEKSTFSYGPHDEEDQKKVSFSYKPQDEEDQKRATFSLGSYSYGPQDEDDQKKVSFSYKPQDEEDQKRTTFSLGSFSYGPHDEEDQKKVSFSYKPQDEDDQKRATFSLGSQVYKDQREIALMHKPNEEANQKRSIIIKGEGHEHADEHDHGNQRLADVFFLEDALRLGSVITPTIPRTTSLPTLLRRGVANSIPFSTDDFADIVAMFAPASLPFADEIRWVLEKCENPRPLTGEKARCATSMEDLVELPMSLLKTRNVQAFSADMPVEAASDAPRGRYSITALRRISDSSEMVSCHDMTYPYAVFYCHTASPATRAYLVTLASADGAVAPQRMEAVAVCHLDTSRWSPEHPFLQALHAKPGDEAACHFLPKSSIVWVPTGGQGEGHAAH